MNSNKNLIQELKKLQAIQPDRAFLVRGRKQFTNQELSPWSIPRWAFASFVVVGALAIFTILPATLPFSNSSTALSADAIQKEFDNLSIGVQLKELEYNQEDSIVSALNEIRQTRIQHLNTDLLNQESSLSNISTSNNEEIEKLLNQIIN
jgi:hypothetical protein